MWFVRRTVVYFIMCRRVNDRLILEVKRTGSLRKSQTVEDFRSAKFDERFDHFLAKPLHGYYERVCNAVWDHIPTFYWLNKGDLSIESEGSLLAAQQQSLSTRAMATVHGTKCFHFL